ncbi:MAG TPA: DUF2285 domain-containing protein [Stellaceae bacterium]|nr:DUF2285 domain-containing protein [Stellaceae bacterium]
MARADWRSASAYEDLWPLDAPAFAYEFLRRNTEFLSDYARFFRAGRRGATDPAEAEAFAQRWGVRFRSQARSRAVLWTPRTLPSVVTLTKTPDGLADPRLELDSRSLQSILAVDDEDQVVELRGARLRLHREEKVGGAVAVLLPLDQLFDIRAAAALRLWRALTGRTPGPDLGVLTPERRSRLILGLRALDGRLERATYPEIAAVLFDTAPISKRDWISHELRDQTGRIVRLGFSMMRGGYRRLLLHPYRRRV